MESLPPDPPLDVPPEWNRIDAGALRGTVLVIGAPDVGKTTFVHYLQRRLRATGLPIAHLDGDPGQSSLGPPATMTAVLNGAAGSANQERTWRSFVGATTPVGHMLDFVVGGWRLVQAARQAGAAAVLYDTCGLVDPEQGGLALKLAKIDLLRPAAVFAIQRERELEPLLVPLRRSRRTQVVDLRPSIAVRRRARPARQANRARRYAGYFAGAGELVVDWSRLAVFPLPRFSINRLIALEDVGGFALNLGIILGIDRQARQLTLLAHPQNLRHVSALHVGDVEIDPGTFRDRATGHP